ncbi:MAG: 16S rRNA (guanine(527)-N(7))-methyltransferase RsmG [Betaproteobacteria bacterium]|nr:16S rRNA (guanine(527)-N(7))-methyltransferase RsmG [Betaproteobacteria bacterium]
MNTTAAHTASQDLDAVLRSLRLDASEQQRAQLLQYLELLGRWNQVYNLTAVREPERMLTLHLADCLAALPALDRRTPHRLLDVGSGGGLPGLVLAIMRPQWQLVLVEAVQKKCAFLRQVAVTLALRNVQVEHQRVEQLHLPGFDCITSRALGDLAEFVRISEHLLLPGGAWAAMKGQQPDAELRALPAGLQHQVEPLEVPGLAAQRCLVWLWRNPPSPEA